MTASIDAVNPMCRAVRPATIDDVPAIVALGRSFVANSQYATLIRPDDAAMAETVTSLIDKHIILVLERYDGELVGMLGMATYSHAVSGEKCACEMFWWIEPAYRGWGIRMLHQAERWAADRGALFIQMIQPVSEPRLGDIYERMGYTPIERQFQKWLGGKQ